MRTPFVFALAALVAASPAAAQHDHTSAYAGQHSPIASLSEQEIDNLRAGDGMGLARAAELNHFPGPKHVLEMADSLGLTADQKSTIEAIRQRMNAEAVRLGQAIIEKETELSRRFEHAHIDTAMLRYMTAEIARLQGELRAVHLAAHIETKALLRAEQIAAYDRLRGYTSTTGR